MRLSTLVSLALAGCGGGDAKLFPDCTEADVLLFPACEEAETPEDQGDTDCAVDVVGTVPADGAVDAYYRGWIEFRLDAADATAAVETDIPGAQLVSDDGTVVYWVPSSPLTPSSAYSATLRYSCGDVTIAFTTSALGEPAEPADLVDRTYAIDFTTARFVEPVGLGDVLATQLELLLGVRTADDATVELVVATGVAAGQDYCVATGTLPAADLVDNPYFSVAAHDTTVSLGGDAVLLRDLAITGTFAADGTWLGGGTLSGTLDTRPDGVGDPGALCDLVLNFGGACVACASDGEPYCLPLDIDQIGAEEVVGLVVHDVAGAGCADCATWTTDTVPAVEDQVCPPG